MNVRRRWTTVLSAFATVLLAVAVATRSAGAQVRITLPSWHEPIVLDTLKQDYPLNAEPAAVYSAVLKAFGELEIPTGRTDSKAGIVGSERFEKTRNLAKAPLSRWFSCGESATGPNADAYRLSIAIAAWVQPSAGGGTTLGVAAVASAQDFGGVAKRPTQCGSTGLLEQRIATTVEKLLK
ncbi:MAG: hypothetical protein FJ202_11225 [Gemmatimonadetes bacterium]|nr:hypothetical protein [Gemmatimonadota bacterium]